MKTHSLEVSGNFTCFTRPEMKVEHVSCDLITLLAMPTVYDGKQVPEQ